MDGTLRSDLYAVLAEALSDPPDWLALSGCQWPLYSIATALDIGSSNARQALERIRGIPPEPAAIRQERYDALFSGPGRPRFWLHESLYRSGRLFGSETIEVEGIYRATGLVTEGSELPDHASLELAFLAYVANQQTGFEPESAAWLEIERNFMTTHAGLWLPALGRDLAGSGDEVYAPIGQFLAGWLVTNRQPHPHVYSPLAGGCSPILQNGANCSLCGFCVQVCSSQVLRIRESPAETVLLRTGKSCSGCGKCVKICPEQALILGKSNPVDGTPGEMAVLHSSPRAHCPKCGRPTVSQAELECIVRQTGPLPWLELCQECRFISMEEAL